MKMYRWIGVLLLGAMPFWMAAQPAMGCGEAGRYLIPVFDMVQSTNVVYGNNRTVDGRNRVLTMDVYEPVGDGLEMRPAIIWVHGGSFVTGSRLNMREFAEVYAQLGYVTASIDYRLFPLSMGIPDSLEALDTAIKAVGDLKAAIRHLREDAETTNRFRVDPNHIIIGGLSAGAITALHAGFLDADDDIPPHVLQILDDNGGLEGSSGDSSNMSYSSSVRAVINLSGAIYNDNWITANDPPVASYHAKNDDVVPYFDEFARIAGINIIRLKGSGIIHQRADEMAVNNYLLGLESGGHNEIYTSPAYADERAEFTLEATLFLHDIICNFPSANDPAHRVAQSPNVYPNPASDLLHIQWDTEALGSEVTVQVRDLQGRLVRSEKANGSGEVSMARQNLPAGMYLIQVFGLDRASIHPATKVVFSE
jgi:hypothetical protein